MSLGGAPVIQICDAQKFCAAAYSPAHHDQYICIKTHYYIDCLYIGVIWCFLVSFTLNNLVVISFLFLRHYNIIMTRIIIYQVPC